MTAVGTGKEYGLLLLICELDALDPETLHGLDKLSLVHLCDWLPSYSFYTLCILHPKLYSVIRTCNPVQEERTYTKTKKSSSDTSS